MIQKNGQMSWKTLEELIGGRINHVKTREKEVSHRRSRICKSPNVGNWDTILNFHVKLGKPL